MLLQRNRPEDVGRPPIEQYHGEPPDVPAAAGAAPAVVEREGKLNVVSEDGGAARI